MRLKTVNVATVMVGMEAGRVEMETVRLEVEAVRAATVRMETASVGRETVMAETLRVETVRMETASVGRETVMAETLRVETMRAETARVGMEIVVVKAWVEMVIVGLWGGDSEGMWGVETEAMNLHRRGAELLLPAGRPPVPPCVWLAEESGFGPTAFRPPPLLLRLPHTLKPLRPSESRGRHTAQWRAPTLHHTVCLPVSLLSRVSLRRRLCPLLPGWCLGLVVASV